jgi:hypothetical protein
MEAIHSDELIALVKRELPDFAENPRIAFFDYMKGICETGGISRVISEYETALDRVHIMDGMTLRAFALRAFVARHVRDTTPQRTNYIGCTDTI